MTLRSNRIQRLDRDQIARIITSPELRGTVPDADQAEMAIPSYLNDNPFVRAMFWRRYDLVHRLAKLTPEMVVCEFGCGIGVFLPTLAAEVRQVYAVDLFPQYAQALAGEKGLDITFSKDLVNIPDGTLDLIFAVEVMEHLDDPASITRLFLQKLKPDGRLIMSGPTESRLYKFGRALVGYNKYHDYHEHNVFELRQIISENGFDLQRTIRYPSPLLPLFLVCLYRVKSEGEK